MRKCIKKPPRHLEIGTLFQEEARKLTGASLRTWQRWQSGTTKPPHSALELLRVHTEGKLLPDSWKGFKFDDTGRLYTPYAQSFTGDDIQKMFWFMQELQRLRAEVRRITRDFDLVPKPDTAAIQNDRLAALSPLTKT